MYVNDFVLYFIQEDEYPAVQLSVFIDQPTPFLTDALQKIAKQEYPKKRMDLFIQNQVP